MSRVFYNYKVYEKFSRMRKWCDKLCAVIFRPSWEPKDSTYIVQQIPVEDIPKYEVKLPTWCNIYLAAHYIIVIYGFVELTIKYVGMSPISVVIFVLYVIASLTIIGMLFDNTNQAAILEVLRCSALAFLTCTGIISNPGIAMALQFFYVVSALFWSLNTLKILEIKKTSKLD